MSVDTYNWEPWVGTWAQKMCAYLQLNNELERIVCGHRLIFFYINLQVQD